MSDIKFTESSLEIAVIEQLQELGYDYAIDTDQWCLSRALDSFINEELLLDRLMAINPGVKITVLEQAISRLKNLDNPSLFERNHIVHRWLTDGMQVEDYESDVNPLVRFLISPTQRRTYFKLLISLNSRKIVTSAYPMLLFLLTVSRLLCLN